MPRRQSVLRLTDLAVESIGNIIGATIEAATSEKSWVCNSGLLQEKEKLAMASVDFFVANLGELLLSSAPCNVHRQLCDIITKTISDAVSRSDKTEVVHVLVRFAGLVVHPHVSTLDLSQLPKVLREFLAKHMGKMVGLETLNFGYGYNGDRTALLSSLGHFVNLRSLCLPSDCHDDTLAVVGQTCRHLLRLNINGSANVTDAGAECLLLCRDLQYLDLYRTSISVGAYARLLLRLPNLRSVGRCDDFGDVLEEYRHRGGGVELELQSFQGRDMSGEKLQLLVQVCPKLTHVCLYLDDGDEDVEILQQLLRLQELKLSYCGFYSAGVDRLLRRNSGGLRLLHLEHVDEMDMDALCCIAEHCLGLRELVLFSCDFTENFGESRLGNSSKNIFLDKPFEYLENFICVSETAPNVIEFFLTLAQGLQTVRFGSSVWINDDTVSRVLAQGGLRRATEIRIPRTFELTVRSVELLLESCPNLRVLSELEGWEGVTKQEVQNLRSRMEAENYDLVI